MKLLLDAHTLLWYSAGDSRLSDHARSLIENHDNERVVSVASLWEIAIKSSLKKLELFDSFEAFVAGAMDSLRFTVLEVTLEHLSQIEKLPFHHRDPFDRMIISQSLVESIEVVGADSSWDAYGVRRHWRTSA